MDSNGPACISEETDGPVRPDRLSVDWREQTDSLVLIQRAGGLGGCVMLFLVVWFIGIAFGLGALLFKLSDPQKSLGCNPVLFSQRFWCEIIVIDALLATILLSILNIEASFH